MYEMKKIITIFVCLVFAVSSCFGFSLRKKHILEDIFAIPTVKEISYYSEKHDFSYCYTVYLIMQNGMKIILKDCKYENGKIIYEKIWRFGENAIFSYSYNLNNEDKKFRYKLSYNSDFETILPSIRKFTYKNSVEELLLNYEEIAKNFDSVPLVDSAVISEYRRLTNVTDKTEEEYYEMVKSEYSYKLEETIFGCFRINANDYSVSEFLRFDNPKYIK